MNKSKTKKNEYNQDWCKDEEANSDVFNSKIVVLFFKSLF